jgi:hypothetical protein
MARCAGTVITNEWVLGGLQAMLDTLKAKHQYAKDRRIAAARQNILKCA